ncbi:MAG: hypothetical protein QOI10_776 [Solirubrobacterales bacterium]|jgi:hypothetical protein|nr:hypothetical protein [Solirubrobacterales bacterium]
MRSRPRAATLRGVTSLICATGLLAVPAAGADIITGTVDYKDKSCQLGDLIPTLKGAVVFAERGAETDSDKIDANGNYKLEFKHGSGAAKASVLLDGGGVRVTRANGRNTWELPLGKIAPGDENLEVVPDNGGITPAGAANIFFVLSQGAAVARAVSPVKIDKVRVIWPTGETDYEKKTKTIRLEAGTEWAPAVPLHEFGHHVLATVADPHSPGGEHNSTKTYPKKPALPLDEGFGEAFAAVTLNDPAIRYPSCSASHDLGASPATTSRGAIKPPRLAQYNEVRDAGLFWHLAQYLGARAGQGVQDGLHTILSALHVAKFFGGPARNMRQVRDALIQTGVETDKDEHDAIDSVFESQGIGWGVMVNVMFADTQPGGAGAWYENHLVLSSKVGYGHGAPDCEETGNDGSLIGEDDSPPAQMQGAEDFYGTIGWTGDLDYTWHDDCLIAGGDGNVSQDSDSTILSSLLYFRFPYITDSQHLLAPFKLTARYVCADNHPEESAGDANEVAYYTCTADRFVEVTVVNGVADPVTSNIKLPRDQDKQILEFEASGACKLADGKDCSV